jgi:outer membrane protein OmpA-like peptidoglycan-associated protein
MSRRVVVPLLACLALALVAWVPVGYAGLGDALKKKVGDKATKKAEGAIDKATDGTDKAGPTKPEAATGDSAKTASGPAADGPKTPGGGGMVSAVSTKFDYVPGDRVILVDDFKQDELGEFPARWRLAEGTFEVAEMDGERWLRCTSADGRVRLKLPAMGSLPEFWTLEFDFYAQEPMQSALTVSALGKDENPVWWATFPHGTDMAFQTGSISSSTALEESSIEGRHHVMFLARGAAIKAYIERQRMANVPEISTEYGPPSELEFRLWATSHPMITNVRFAEGCRPAKDMLAAGKLVTYGIRFETGSDAVLPDSAPILRQIAAYLEANPGVRLRITGHTDNVGSTASNLDLSKRRAASVAKVLAAQFGVAAARFETDGKGDTQSLASNAKPEGRAMNRRVEFAKL